MTNVGFHLYGVPQRSSSQRQKMEWWLSGEENVGKQGSVGAAFHLKDAESTALDAGDGHTAVHSMPLGYIITDGRRHSLGDIYFTTMKNSKQLLRNIYYLCGLDCTRQRELPTNRAPQPMPCPAPQAEPSPDWTPAPQWAGMGGDPASPLWHGLRANKVHSV